MLAGALRRDHRRGGYASSSLVESELGPPRRPQTSSAADALVVGATVLLAPLLVYLLIVNEGLVADWREQLALFVQENIRLSIYGPVGGAFVLLGLSLVVRARRR